MQPQLSIINMTKDPMIKKDLVISSILKQCSTFFKKEKLFNSMSQAPNLTRLLYRSKFESHKKNHEVKNCIKKCVSCPYLLKASLYLFMQSFTKKLV